MSILRVKFFHENGVDGKIQPQNQMLIIRGRVNSDHLLECPMSPLVNLNQLQVHGRYARNRSLPTIFAQDSFTRLCRC